MKEKRICVFDSGVGALSVLKPLLRSLPNENFYYLGDSLRMPYGEKTPEEISEFTKQGFRLLEDVGIKAGIIACNTATCYGLYPAREEFDFPILGVVGPGSEMAVQYTKNKKVLLLATQATVNSKVYEKFIHEIDPEVEVMAIGCPKLVLAVEQNHFADKTGREVLKEYLDMAKDFDYDTLVLGCTHFPLARALFAELLPPEINVVDPAIATAEQLKKLLEEEGLVNPNGNSDIKFFVTGDVERFKDVASEILGLDREAMDVSRVVLK